MNYKTVSFLSQELIPVKLCQMCVYSSCNIFSFFSWCTQFCKMIMLILWEVKPFYYDDGKGRKANFPGLCMGTWADLGLQTKQRLLATAARCRPYLSLQNKTQICSVKADHRSMYWHSWSTPIDRGSVLISDSFPIGKSPWLLNKHMNCTC